MPYDGVFIHFLAQELANKLIGKKINKIIEPNQLDVVLQIRTKDENNKHKTEQLLISASLDMPRMYLTDEKFSSMDIPKNFCTILRKYIERGIITNLYQVRNDRIIVFEIEGYLELGDVFTSYLIVELMGRNSNIILTDCDFIIIDAIRKVPPTDDGNRLILPKAKYVFPLRVDAINPFDLAENDVVDFSLLEGCSKPLLNNCKSTFDLVNKLKTPIHCYIYKDCSKNHTKFDFYLLPLDVEVVEEQFLSISKMLSTFYSTYKTIYTDKAKELKKVIKNKITKLNNKIVNLDDDLEQASLHLECNHLGLLLQCNLYKVKKGDTSVEVIDFVHDNQLVEIPLDPLLDPSINLKKLFTKGKKAKTALEIVLVQKEKTIQEIAYLENIYTQIDFANSTDLDEIKAELIANKYLKESKKNQLKKKKMVLTKYDLDGIEVIVGKNNFQNDFITNKLAKSNDWWFHVKDMPGSHVLFRSPTPNYELSEKEIRFCANLAASFSKAEKSSSVPVDYLLARFIKKIPGVRGCEVTYTNQKTIYIDPNLN